MVNKLVLSFPILFLAGHLCSKKTGFLVCSLGSLQLLRAQEQNNRVKYGPELELADFSFSSHLSCATD